MCSPQYRHTATDHFSFIYNVQWHFSFKHWLNGLKMKWIEVLETIPNESNRKSVKYGTTFQTPTIIYWPDYLIYSVSFFNLFDSGTVVKRFPARTVIFQVNHQKWFKTSIFIKINWLDQHLNENKKTKKLSSLNQREMGNAFNT